MNRTYSTSSKSSSSSSSLSNLFNRTVTLSNSYKENDPVYRPTALSDNVKLRQQSVSEVFNDKNNTIVAFPTVPLCDSKNDNFNLTLPESDRAFEGMNVFNPMAFARLNRCINVVMRSHKADAAVRKTNLKNHMQKMVASKAEMAKLEREISEEERAIRLVEKQTKEEKEKLVKGNEKLLAKRKEVKEESLKIVKEVEELKTKITELYERDSVPMAIVRCFKVDPGTLCCPEGKKTVPEGDCPPECDIFKCPAACQKSQ